MTDRVHRHKRNTQRIRNRTLTVVAYQMGVRPNSAVALVMREPIQLLMRVAFALLQSKSDGLRVLLGVSGVGRDV